MRDLDEGTDELREFQIVDVSVQIARETKDRQVGDNGKQIVEKLFNVTQFDLVAF